MRLRRSELILSGTALFALAWALARACIQSITIDEADTYLAWVAPPNPAHWYAASNNHVLNSILMRLTTALFGVSHLSVRAPALLGGAIYIAAAYALCVKLIDRSAVRWPAFVCLVYNPLVFDYFVAARGYSLALGFFTAILAIVACFPLRETTLAACSICAALSIAGNFSFAVVDAVVMIAILIWACARTQVFQTRVRLLGACVLPGLLVSALVSAPAVLHWDKGAMVYGAHSLREIVVTLAGASLFRPNPEIVNPLLLPALERIRPYLLPALLLLAAYQWVRRRDRVALTLLATLTAALAIHWIAFHFAGVLLPRERTALWIVPLLTLAIAIAAPGRRALTAMLYVTAICFLACGRLGFFREWEWNADVNRTYGVVAWYNHARGITDVVTNWRYGSSLNFYRLQSGRETFGEIPGFVDIPPGHALYVLHGFFDQDFIDREHLCVVYRAPHDESVVAVRAASRPVR